MKKKQVRERAIVILQESAHFVIVRPPCATTTQGEVLDDFEFIWASGYRPLAVFKAFGGVDSKEDAILCEKMEPPV